MVQTQEARRLTAYHESGHALVAMHTDGTDPIHKATIVPRGHALGMVSQVRHALLGCHSYLTFLSAQWPARGLAAFSCSRVAMDMNACHPVAMCISYANLLQFMYGHGQCLLPSGCCSARNAAETAKYSS